MNEMLPIGARVIVRHLTGIVEYGVIRGRTRPMNEYECGRYDVEFDDRSWMSCIARTVAVAP